MSSTHPDRHPFRIDPRYRIPALLVGVRDDRAWVQLDELGLEVRFGRWRVSTPLENVIGAGVSGPYSFLKTVGPAHLSLADRGLTFATNGELGVCFTFDHPVRGIEPTGRIRHRGLTVTVADPEILVATAVELGIVRTDRGALRRVQAAEDALHTRSAAQLRELARERGVAHPSSIKKADLVRLLEQDLDAELVDDLVDHRHGPDGR